MSDHSAIEWTDASWNPIRARNLKTSKIGWHCEHATTGCELCYAEAFNLRLGTGLPFKPGHRKDVEIFLDENMLTLPLRWKKPRKIFVGSMTDLFADFVTYEWLDKIFAVMALCPQHTFQVLTKRAERMRNYCGSDESMGRILSLSNAWLQDAGSTTTKHQADGLNGFVLPNVWLGVSCERQEEADERIPFLLDMPAAIRFISAEPLLGPINIDPFLNYMFPSNEFHGYPVWNRGILPGLDWIIVGGESGRNARVMEVEWARSIRDQCQKAGTAFFFKQWGEWQAGDGDCLGQQYYRVGKKAAGRSLDGRTWDKFPQARA